MGRKMATKIRALIIFSLFKIDKLSVSLLKKVYFRDLIYLSNHIKNHQEYEELMLKIIELQKLNLKEKAQKGKIKVGFLVDSSSVWGFGDVYNALAVDSAHYEPYVIIPLMLVNKEIKKESQILKRDTIRYFKKAKIKYYIVKEKRKANWGGLLPDILLSQVPYPERYYQDNFCLENIPCISMQMFVPYSFWIALVDYSFCFGNTKICSKIFLPSKIHVDILKSSGNIDSKRLFYSGYPKCDSYYHKENPIVGVDKIWKNGNNKAHIIYAPGFMDSVHGFSTFNLNYMQVLELAKKTKDTVSWVIRLHPMMAESCIEQGVFQCMNEWNSYIAEWEKLDNTMVSIHGGYEDIFKTSDAMIMDSISFLPSYQYVHKPLLFLTRRTQRMNKLGHELRKVVYTADARDIDGIETFISNVVIEGRDVKKELREKFFEDNLDYYHENKQLASEYIVSHIEELR